MTSTLDEMVDIYKRAIHCDISHWNNAQLEELLNNEDKMDDLIKSQSQAMKTLEELRKDRLRLGKMFAESNLSMKPKFEQLQTSIETSRTQIEQLDEEVKKMKHELDTLSDNRSLNNIAILMNVAIRKTEDESDTYSDKFTDGRIGVDEFVTKFTNSRQLYHIRKLKHEKFVEILRHQF
ncbi:VPS37 C-terminal domain-containing protein [Aphelenchoides besseyi]|nr:VPS37 C-terminal domain-containing protein [Aphelenchoides besseyi]